MKFSERMGFVQTRKIMQIDSIDTPLKNSLWNILTETFWNGLYRKTSPSQRPELHYFLISVWRDFFKSPIDQIPIDLYLAVQELRLYFFHNETPWNNIYDLIEFTSTYINDQLSSPYQREVAVMRTRLIYFTNKCNQIFQEEMSAYRYIDNTIAPITSSFEIKEIEEGLNLFGQYKAVGVHLKQALALLSDRANPDFRNSIKESISAVESLCKVITQNPKGTLGEGLKQLEKNGVKIHPSLRESFNKLYGYTSDEKGIRHALVNDDSSINFEDAKFMLVSCSGFCNYLISKIMK